MLNAFRRVWGFRQFILGNVRREFQTRYRNSLLGFAWIVLNPLSQILIYTVIFAQVMKARLPGVDHAFGYSIFLCSGIIVWGLFSEITGKCQTMFLDNANLIKKVSFPKLCIPISIVINASLNFVVIFTLFTLFLVVTDNFPGYAYFAVFPLLGILILFSVGLGLIVGVLNVFFRDAGHFYGIFLHFWFWLTPIVYPESILPAPMRTIINLNPMTGLIKEIQAALVYGQWPTYHWVYLATLALALCGLAVAFFRKRSAELVDEL